MCRFMESTCLEQNPDAYNNKAMETGFYQGGKIYYGYESERRTVNGKTGSVLVPSDKADVIRKAYQIYKHQETSLQDIINYFRDNKIDVCLERKSGRTNMDRSHFPRLLESSLYVRAYIEVYRYLVSKGFTIVDDVEAFDGIHGLFRHKNADGSEYIKVGYHEGLIDSETWLTVQDKKSHNQKNPQ